MAKILVKNSVASGSAPAGLSLGEMAINITDKKIFIGNAVEAAVAIYDPNSHVLSFNGSTGAVVFNNYVTSINGKTGDVTGISASTVMLGSTNSNATRYLVFAATAGDQSLLIDNVTTPLSYNPNTGTVGAKIFDATVGVNQVKLDASIGNISVSDGADISTAVSYGFEHSGSTPHYFYTAGASPSTFIVTPALRVSDGDYNVNYGPSTWGYTFPAANGTSGQAMFTNGGGQLYWGTVTSGSAATGVISFNGATGAIGITAGSNITITQSGNTFTISSTASGSGAGFTYTSSAPPTPAIGDRWMDSDNGKEYVYVNDGTSSQWIEPTSSNGLEGLTYYAATKLYEFGGTGSFVKIGVGTTSPASTLDVVGTAAITSTTNSLDIIATTDGAGLRIAKATTGANSRVGGIRLGRSGTVGANVYLEGSIGVFTVYNGVGDTGTNMFRVSNSQASFGVPIVGPTFNSAPSSDGGYRITSNAINALTGTTYSLLTSDDGKVITWSNASGVTLTVPSGLPVGFNTTIIQIGAGSVGITGSGTTLNSFEGKLRTAGQHAAVSIISYSSNVFNIAGGLTG